MSDAAHPGWWGFILKNYLLLVFGTVAGLVWANISPDSYEPISHALHFPVNEIAMVFFFALAGKEIIEATLPGGPLASPREAAVPLLAAVGGMAAPALIYTFVVSGGPPELTRGWAIPCATDIAFSYMAARMLFPAAHPAVSFLLLLAIADDALGLILLAVFYPVHAVAPLALIGWMVPALAFSYALKRRRVQNFWAYTILGGGLSWAALYLGGLNPALALIPVLPFMPHAARDRGLFNEGEMLLPDTMNRFERWWHVPVHIILFFFGLTNAGVVLSSVGLATWGVLAGLLIGKPVGIVLAVFIGLRVGLRAPGGLSYKDLVVTSVAASIGFTVSLFIATAAFPPGLFLEQAKMGALLSFGAFPLALGVGRLLLRPAAAR